MAHRDGGGSNHTVLYLQASICAFNLQYLCTLQPSFTPCCPGSSNRVTYIGPATHLQPDILREMFLDLVMYELYAAVCHPDSVAFSIASTLPTIVAFEALLRFR